MTNGFVNEKKIPSKSINFSRWIKLKVSIVVMKALVN